MTIRPGDGWGEIIGAPPETRWFDSEAELCVFLDASTEEVPVGLTGGDLHHVTGEPTATMRVSLDEMVVRYVPVGSGTTRTTRALSFVTVGRWRRPTVDKKVASSTFPSFGWERANHSDPFTIPELDTTLNSLREYQRPTVTKLSARVVRVVALPAGT